MVKWYPFLNSSDKENLYKYEKFEQENLVVCHELKYRRYGKFNNYLDFKNFKDRLNFKDVCFYEIIREDSTRKPYFDIDMPAGSLEKPDSMVLEILEIIKTLLTEVTILVYTSHTKTKNSYHIVVSNYYLDNHLGAKKFFQTVKEKLNILYYPYLDESVYKTIQQFRILGTHKWDKDNTKILDDNLSYNYNIPERYIRFPKGLENYHLLNSLVSIKTGCKYLDGYKEVQVIQNFNINGYSSSGDLEDVLNIFYNTHSNDIFNYLNHRDDNGNLLITFRRLKSSYCQECDRVHENENPFLVVSGINRNIYYYCRRRNSNEGGKFLGSLGPEIIPDLSIEDIPVLENNDNYEMGTSIVDIMKSINGKKTKKKAVILTDFLKI